MANKDGLITRKDIIEDQALTIGIDYAKNMQPAIEANKQLVDSLKEMAPFVNAFRKVDSQQAFIEAKNKENLITLKAINANKLLEASEISLQKVIKESINTSKAELDLDVKKAKSTKEITSLLQQEEVLKAKKLATDREEAKLLKELESLEIKKQSTKKGEISILQQEEKLKRDRLSTIKSENQLIIQEQQTIKNSLSIKSKELSIVAQQEAAKKRNTQLTIEERVQNEINNRALKQAAREQLGLVGAYEKLNKARTDAKNRLRDLIAAEGSSTAEIKKAQKEYDVLNRKVRAADHAVDDFTKSVGNYPFSNLTSGLKNLISAFGVIGGITLFKNIVTDIFNTTKELQSLDLALKSVTGTQEEFTKQQLFLATISEKYGLNLQNLTKQFIAFYVSAKDKVSGREIQEIFENISKAGSALGLSNETLERSFVAVNQMLSKGTVASEELRGQLAEAMPGAVQAMTKAVQKLHPEIKNLTEKGLFQMIKDGKILANEVLPETSRQLLILTGADKAEGIETLTKLTNRLSNSWTNMVRSINESDSSGFGIFVKKITAGLSNIADFVGLLFKDEKQLQSYFQNLGKQKGLEEYQAIMKNIASTSKENIELTKQELLVRERENLRVNQAIIKAEKEKRDSILGGDRALFHKQTKMEEDALLQIGKSAEIIKQLRSSTVETKPNKTVEEESEKDRKARLAKEKKDRQDYLAYLKKFEDDVYNLEKFRLDRIVELNQDVVNDEKKTTEQRLNAYLEIEQVKVASSDAALRHELVINALSKIDAETTSKAKMDSIKKEAELKADSLIRGVKLSENATNAEKLIYEKYQKEREDIERKSQENRQKIIDTEVDRIQKQTDSSLQSQDTELNKALEAENIKFKALTDGQSNIKKATEEHERQVLAIKELYIKKGLQTQIDAIQNLLDAQDLLPEKERISADKRAKIEADLSKYKLQLSEELITGFSNNIEKRVELEKQAAQTIKELSENLTFALVDLTNAILDARISNIENDIDKSNEYYDRQIELAGNDARQKDLLEKERVKKEKALEKEKQKEIVKQAVFNKAIALAEIGLNLAKTISALNLAAAAIDAISFGVGGNIYRSVQIPLAIGLAAAQAATVVATPIPKYKHGREGGPAEVAEVGDGGVREVISRPDGSGARVTPNKPTLTYLQKDDIVHKSMDDYENFMRQSILKGFYKEKEKASTYQIISSSNSVDNTKELREIKDEIRKQKTQVHVTNNIDLGYEYWRSGNIKWRG